MTSLFSFRLDLNCSMDTNHGQDFVFVQGQNLMQFHNVADSSTTVSFFRDRGIWLAAIVLIMFAISLAQAARVLALSNRSTGRAPPFGG